MRLMSVKSFIMVAMMTVGFVPVSVAGSLDSLMDDMFSASTAAQPYSTNDRNGRFFGSYALHTPVKNYTLINFDKPSMSAGCSGINLSGGSVSIMNSDEFKQMLRQIASNSTMYLFKLVIDTISPRISSIMNKVEDIMRAFTLNNINTCKIGEKVATAALNPKDTWNAATDGLQTAWADAKQVGGNLASDFTGLFNKSMEEKAPADNSDGTKDWTTGNISWKALRAKGVADIIGSATLSPDPLKMTEYMMNFMPIKVIDQNAGKTEAGNAVPCTSACTPTNIPYPINAVGVKPIDLYMGKSGNKKYYSCGSDTGEDGCLTPTPVDFDFVGTKAVVEAILYGPSRSKDYPEDGSLIQNLSKGEELTPPQLSLLLYMPAEFLNDFVKVQKNAKAATMVVEAYSDYIALEAANKMTVSMLSAIDYAFSGRTGNKSPVYLDKEQDDALKERVKELADMQADARKKLESATTVVSVAVTIAEANRKLFWTPTAGIK